MKRDGYLLFVGGTTIEGGLKKKILCLVIQSRGAASVIQVHEARDNMLWHPGAKVFADQSEAKGFLDAWNPPKHLIELDGHYVLTPVRSVYLPVLQGFETARDQESIVMSSNGSSCSVRRAG